MRDDVQSYALSEREPDLIIPLWPDKRMPGGPTPDIRAAVDDQQDNSGFRYRVAEHVTAPNLSFFAPRNPTGAAVLIIPGGGYSRVGVDREGYETARLFSERGSAAFVLRYRLPADGWGAGPLVALQDAQRAIRLIRQGTSAWSIDRSRVTVLGGSAGGHLALSLCIKVYQRTYAVLDEADHLLTRPDGAILLYPVVTMGEGAHVGSRTALLGSRPTAEQIAEWSFDRNLPGITPPLFVAHALHDRVVPADHSLGLLNAVRASGGSIDLHLFDEGAHGVGLRGEPALPMSAWPELAVRWQVRQGLQ